MRIVTINHNYSMLKCMKNALTGLIDRIVQGCKSDYRKTFTICIRRNIVEARSLKEIDRTRDHLCRWKLSDNGGIIFLDMMTCKRHFRYGYKVKTH